MSEREEVRAGLERGENFTAIAAMIGRAVSTVSREVAVNDGRDGYRACRAHRDAGRRARRPKTPKLVHGHLAEKDLGAHSAEDLERIARSLNNRPRETLGFMKPSERLAELLALTG